MSSGQGFSGVLVPVELPFANARNLRQVRAVPVQSLQEMGGDGRVALAWGWALTSQRQSPVTLMPGTGRPPTWQEIQAEADANPVGSTAPPGVPTDFCDQLGEARRVLRWLTGDSDEIPVEAENRGRFIGARDNYAHTDEETRQAETAHGEGLPSPACPNP